MKSIDVQQATVRTASVEVRVLAISGKQVTLAVFRQLQEEQVIDPETLQLRGIPWGKVHYFWGDCAKADPATHLHVVWQKGSELRRCCVEPDHRREPAAKRLAAAHRSGMDGLVELAFLTAALLERPAARQDGLLRVAGGNAVRCRVQRGGAVTVRVPLGDDVIPSCTEAVELADALWDAIEWHGRVVAKAALDPEEWPPGTTYPAERSVIEAKQKVADRIDSLHSALESDATQIDPSDVVGSCRRLWSETRERLDTLKFGWRARHAELSSLDQLFIAV